jgi:tryptophan-rich sensory protein
MGISLYIIRTKKNNFLALKFFGAQLILNLLWSIIFFGLKNITLAFAEIVLLWIFIVLTISSFRKLSKTASNLLIPYLIWVTFAGYLNYSLMVLNI